ncbi:MAG TPA: hypothetical protein VFT45_03875, partial [Longimicrobium sp.]|nr:hypothetical protein [Longimicrobium sp.]
IWPSFKRPLAFRPGIGLLARELAPLAVLPIGLHVEPLSATRPTVFASSAELISIDRNLDLAGVESAVAREIDAIHAFLSRHGEDAPRHWPGPQGRLPAAIAPAEIGR